MKIMFGYEDELQIEIEILKEKLEKQKEISNELLEALQECVNYIDRRTTGIGIDLNIAKKVLEKALS
ncbi:hypothetical protein ACYE2N_01625 [Flavobacterium sp. MAHUQ-51]|uniref:hypothetical protein n=1 Tax=Flavobacterium sp. GCM10022190 TaxID=3252639 RepID=UPI003614E984